MARVRLSDRLLAVIALATGIFSFREMYLARGSAPRLLEDPHAAPFFVAGIACLLAAWWLWTGKSQRARAGGRPRFGRGAAAPAAGGSRLRPLFGLVVGLTILAIVADRAGFFPTTLLDPAARRLIREEARPPEPVMSRPTEEMAAPPAPIGEDNTEQETARQEPAKPAPVERSGDGGGQKTVAPPVESREQQPSEVAPASPPRTEVPLPKPEPMPAEAGGHCDAVVWLAMAPDGHSLLSASTDHTIKLWDIDGPRLVEDLGSHGDMARSALFLPGGERALTAGDDGEIVLRSVEDGAVLHVFSGREHGGANALAISPDGRRAASAHEAGTVIVWDIGARSALRVLPGNGWSVNAVAISPDGGQVLYGSIDGTLQLWDVDAGRLLRMWHGHERGVYGAAFMPDGRHAVTASGDYTLKLWDIPAGEEVRRFEGHSATVYAVAVSDDGERMLSGSLDGTARLWETATGNEVALFAGHLGPVYAVAFAANGTVLTGGRDRTIRIWPAGGGEAIAVLAGAPE